MPISWCGRKFENMFVLTKSNRSLAYCMMAKGREAIGLSFIEPGWLSHIGDIKQWRWTDIVLLSP